MSYHALPDHSPEDSFGWIPTLGEEEEDLKAEDGEETLADQVVSSLDGLVRWEARQHLQVADGGYAFEHCLAAFPLYPLAVKSFAGAARWPLPRRVLSRASLLKLSAAYLNLVAFVVAADLLYSLSRRVLRDEALAYRAALLFCLNPASVFFSAPGYSESIFSASVFASMLAVEKHGPGVLSAVLLLLASGVKAVGVGNAVFVVYHSMKTVATETILFVRAKKKDSAARAKKAPAPQTAQAPSSKASASDTMFAIGTGAILPGMLSVVSATVPFLAFQWYSHRVFCATPSSELDFPEELRAAAAQRSAFVMADAANKSSWCMDDPPVPYLYVEERYFGGGFLRGWETKNFLQLLSAFPAAGEKELL